MAFKRGALLMAVAMAVASVQATDVELTSKFKHPVVKGVTRDHGKIRIVLQEGAEAKKHAPHHAKHRKFEKHVAKKHEAKEAKKDGETVTKYAHGNVKFTEAKKGKKEHAKKEHAKKEHKTHTKEMVEEDVAEGSYAAEVEETEGSYTEETAGSYTEETDGSYAESLVEEETDVNLEEGESVVLTYGKHTFELTHMKNGSVILVTDGVSQVLPEADDMDLYLDDVDVDEITTVEGSVYDDLEAAASAGSEGSYYAPTGLLDEVEADVSGVAKKFTELATELTGDSKYFSKGAAPVVFVCAVLGALAAVVGVAAIAISRSRETAAAPAVEDPASVLSEDAADDVDVEANVTAVTVEDAEEDAAADESESLDGSESEDDEEEEANVEEGKFTNEGSV